MEIKCTMDWKSIDTLIANLRGILDNIRNESGEILKNIGTDIMLESFEECPKDTWTLVSSGYVTDPIVTNDKVSVEIGYGGPEDKVNPKTGKLASEYMFIVHEDYEKYATKRITGKSKFFEDPVRRAETKFKDDLANSIRVILTKRPAR
jgi:hypothetical protein